MPESGIRISLGKRLRNCRSFRCLGVRANWDDYSEDDCCAVRSAPRVAYPSSLYEPLLRSVGKGVFPRNYYSVIGNKIVQTELFQLLGVPHPRTRIYYGDTGAGRVLADFSLPVVGKTPLGSSQGEGVWLLRTEAGLEAYLREHRPAYIQEYLPIERDLRVVVIAGRAVHAYWRIARTGEFRNNVSRGGTISYENVPEAGVSFAEEVCRRCRFDEVGLDVCRCPERGYMVIEANMAFGLEGFRRANLDIYRLLAQLDEEDLV
jgi:ribosomal protein S6--L-glutamate ligase